MGRGLDPRLPVPYYDPNDTTEYEIQSFTLIDEPPPTLAHLFDESGAGEGRGRDGVPPSQPNISTSSHMSTPSIAQPLQPVAFVNRSAPHCAPTIQNTGNFIEALNLPAENEMQGLQLRSEYQVGQSSNNLGLGLKFVLEEFVTGLSVPPEEPLPFTCHGCHLSRDVIHKNGTHTIVLELHRRMGSLCHAILRGPIEDVKLIAAGADPSSISSTDKSPVFDLSRSNVEEINGFLMQYCIKLHFFGYSMVSHITSNYYETLCTALDWIDELSDRLSAEDFADRELAVMVEWKKQEEEKGEEDEELKEEDVGKYSLSEQRDRVMNTKLSDLSDYFMMPLEKASKQVNMCPTAVKKICRRSGLNRWPNRKVKSIVSRMSHLKKSFESSDAKTRKIARDQMARLYEELVQCCGGVAPTGIDWNNI